MKKWIALFLSACILLTAAGCSGPAEQSPAVNQYGAEDETPSVNHSENQAVQPSGERNSGEQTPEMPRILIAYFTWADKTVVEDPSAVDVDATTSASVPAPGNAAKIAGWI